MGKVRTIMTRTVLIGLGGFILVLTLLGIWVPASELNSFLTLSQKFTVFRLAAATFVLFYGFVRPFRLLPIRILLGIFGVGLIGFGTIGILIFYMLPIDIFLFEALGIFALLASIEIPADSTLRLPLKIALVPQFSLPRATKLVKAVQANLPSTGRRGVAQA